MTFEVMWSEHHKCWIAWCHEYGKPEARAADPVKALSRLLARLDKEAGQ
jgi:hypothetical protein